MKIDIDVAEVYECNFEIANLLLKNGWILLHSFTVVRAVQDDIADTAVHYSLLRPKHVSYTAQMAEEQFESGCPF